jgi:hypothetical protein
VRLRLPACIGHGCEPQQDVSNKLYQVLVIH